VRGRISLRVLLTFVIWISREDQNILLTRGRASILMALASMGDGRRIAELLPGGQRDNSLIRHYRLQLKAFTKEEEDSDCAADLNVSFKSSQLNDDGNLEGGMRVPLRD